MKKLIRFLLIPAMLLCFLSGITVHAAETETSSPTDPTEPEVTLIDTVSVSFPTPVEGAVAVLPVAAGPNYAVDPGSSWWNFISNGTAMGPDETFKPGSGYSVVVTLIPAEGYAFHEGTQLIVNGSPAAPASVSGNSLLYVSDIWHLRSLVQRADVLITPPQVGQAPQYPTVPDEGYHLDSGSTYWWNVTTGKAVAPEDVFEAGCSYMLYLGVHSDLEFAFDGNTTLYVTQTTGGTSSIQITNRTDSLIQGATEIFTLTGDGSETPPSGGNNENPPSDPPPSSDPDVPRTGDLGILPYLTSMGLSITSMVTLGWYSPQKRR